MSEIVTAAEAVAAPLLKDAAAALAPEAEKVLTDLKAYLAEEADKLRAEIPAKAEEAAQHIHDLGTSLLTRYQSVMDRVDAHLTGAPAAASTADPTSAAPAPQSSTQS